MKKKHVGARTRWQIPASFPALRVHESERAYVLCGEHCVCILRFKEGVRVVQRAPRPSLSLVRCPTSEAGGAAPHAFLAFVIHIQGRGSVQDHERRWSSKCEPGTPRTELGSAPCAQARGAARPPLLLCQSNHHQIENHCQDTAAGGLAGGFYANPLHDTHAFSCNGQEGATCTKSANTAAQREPSVMQRSRGDGAIEHVD